MGAEFVCAKAKTIDLKVKFGQIENLSDGGGGSRHPTIAIATFFSCSDIDLVKHSAPVSIFFFISNLYWLKSPAEGWQVVGVGLWGS